MMYEQACKLLAKQSVTMEVGNMNSSYTQINPFLVVVALSLQNMFLANFQLTISKPCLYISKIILDTMVNLTQGKWKSLALRKVFDLLFAISSERK